jgi:hypothetical protein
MGVETLFISAFMVYIEIAFSEKISPIYT